MNDDAASRLTHEAADLGGEATRLLLDHLAVRVGAALTEAGVPYALLKGASTSLWLYDPPRFYNDVDVLVPATRVAQAAAALERAGVARPAGGRVGEEAEHSYLLRSGDGYEVDLHLALPTTPPDGDRYWHALSPHVVPLDLSIGQVDAFDEAARCLVLALHALAGGKRHGLPAEDLRRALAVAAPESWVVAGTIAAELGIADLFTAGKQVARGDQVTGASARARLRAQHAPSAALGLQRLAEAPVGRRPGLLLREVFPSRPFMRHAYPQVCQRRFGLARAHLLRWRALAGQLPLAVRTWYEAHHTRT